MEEVACDSESQCAVRWRGRLPESIVVSLYIYGTPPSFIHWNIIHMAFLAFAVLHNLMLFLFDRLYYF